MVELTIRVPDELAQQLEPFQDRLPALLTRLVEVLTPRVAVGDALALVSSPTDAPLAYAEVLDFLLNRPTPQDIVAFKVSPAAQERLGELLAKNRLGELSETEVAELDLYEQLEHLMILLKAKARALGS
jgi:hypothetical protein